MSFSMHTEHKTLTWTLMLLLTGVLCNMWKVEYQQQHICAVRGSSVVILCSFYHPNNLRVKRVIWGHIKPRHHKGRLVFDSNLRKVTTRFEYVGDKHHSCSLKIHQVMQNDAGKYTITFNNYKIGRWHGNVAPTLKVVDLKILVTKTNGNETVKEGDSVILTCINNCDGHDPSNAFTWFKNGKHINEGSVLYLSNISSENSGNYTCSVKTQTGTTSGVINIDAEYGPKNTSVSVRPSTEVDAGSNITLICSSHSNPRVENYSWFKIDDDDIVEVGHQPVFFTGVAGQYLCSVTNKHGSQNSSVVTLKIKSYWAIFIRDVLIATVVIVAVLLIMVTVIAVRRLITKNTWAPEANCDTQNSDYVNWIVCDNNQLLEENQCEGGITELIYATVYFKDKRKSNGAADGLS